MITYAFTCNDCSIPDGKKVNKHGEKFNSKKIRINDEQIAGWNPETLEYIFYVDSEMKKKPIHPKCPKCGSNRTNSTLNENTNHSYIRGNCYLDKAGAKRDQAVHKLTHEDPYGTMRVSGEVDHMIAKFKNGGRDMAKISRKHYERVNGIVKSLSKSSAAELSAVSNDEKEIIKFIDANDTSRNGIEFGGLPKLHDLNKIMSELIKNGYIATRANGNFSLMAQGRWIADNI